MVKLFINSTVSIDLFSRDIEEIVQCVQELTNLTPDCFYLEQDGKPLRTGPLLESPLYVRLRLLGGKGGFGSMLRAIGAQIEKTTNREACRDLSGRRLRDINEEKRLKAWLEKQGEREREAEERKKRKIEKLLAVPKHEFKDVEYEEARSKLTEKVCDAVEEGFKKSIEEKKDLKRKHKPEISTQAGHSKQKKKALWIDDDLSSDDSEDEVLQNNNSTTSKQKCILVPEENTSLDSRSSSVADK